MTSDPDRTAPGPGPPVRAQDVRAWRERTGLSQRDMATYFGYSRRHWIRYEQGELALPRAVELILKLYPLRLPEL